jgi:Electron transfer DM13
MQIAETLRGTFRKQPGRWVLVAVALALVAAFALYWFAPWNLFVDRRVDESLPGAVGAGETTGAAGGTAGAGGEVTGGVADDTSGEAPAAEAGRVTFAGGEFIDLEHATTGTALVLELEDGSRFLRLEDLHTSNGPDLRVVLTDRPLSDDWHVWDDGELVDLGPLKGNIGSSNYEIPADLDLSRFETAVVWCRRFSVGFGVAPLDSIEA